MAQRREAEHALGFPHARCGRGGAEDCRVGSRNRASSATRQRGEPWRPLAWPRSGAAVPRKAARARAGRRNEMTTKWNVTHVAQRDTGFGFDIVEADSGAPPSGLPRAKTAWRFLAPRSFGNASTRPISSDQSVGDEVDRNRTAEKLHAHGSGIFSEFAVCARELIPIHVERRKERQEKLLTESFCG